VHRARISLQSSELAPPAPSNTSECSTLPLLLPSTPPPPTPLPLLFSLQLGPLASPPPTPHLPPPHHPELIRNQQQPEWTLRYLLGECHFGPKNSRFPGPNPLQLAQIMYLPTSKHYAQGRINHRFIGGFTYKSPPWRGLCVHTSILPYACIPPYLCVHTHMLARDRPRR
jgi:hypothetical protein